MFFESASSHNRVSKRTTFSLAILILALLPVGAFAMGGGTCSPIQGDSCKKDADCCLPLTCQGSGNNKTCESTGGPTPTPPPTGAADHDVIIVGAGAAGLYAAFELTNMGFNVKVLEATDRHGGRVHPETFGGQNIELHAEGVTGNKKAQWHWHDINNLDSSRLELIFPDNGKHTTAYNLDGNRTTGWDAGKKDFPELFDYWDFYYNADEYTGPDVDAQTGICDFKGICPGSIFFHLYDAGYPGSEFGTTIKNTPPRQPIGMRSLAIQEGRWIIGDGEWGFNNSNWLDTLDELYFIPGGLVNANHTVTSKVQLNTTVTAIDTSVSPAVVSAGATDFTAHAVLVTVSLGALKAGGISFNPALSAATHMGISKQAAIDNLGAGNGAKYFLQYNQQVWPSDWVALHTPGVAGYCWAPHWFLAGAANDVLVCFIMGDNADVIEAKGTTAAQVAAINSALDTMTQNNKNPTSTDFTDAFVAGGSISFPWANEESYSYPGIGSEPTDGDPSMRDVLAAPVGTSLYFAGEATDRNHSATVFGALDTGLRAAGEIDLDHNPQ